MKIQIKILLNDFVGKRYILNCSEEKEKKKHQFSMEQKILGKLNKTGDKQLLCFMNKLVNNIINA